jgi:hypothetical protein
VGYNDLLFVSLQLQINCNDYSSVEGLWLFGFFN